MNGVGGRETGNKGIKGEYKGTRRVEGRKIYEER